MREINPKLSWITCWNRTPNLKAAGGIERFKQRIVTAMELQNTAVVLPQNLPYIPDASKSFEPLSIGSINPYAACAICAE
jgi:hypothetical protein